MVKQLQNRSASERHALALIFLVTFGVLTLVSIWLIYQQFAQVFTRAGQCIVLSQQTRQDAVDTDNPTDGPKQFSITFTVSLLTADGQHLQVPGYYTSANYDASDQQTINQLKQTYAIGKTLTCGYTYLDPSGIKAIFQPAIPLEGFLFPGFFLVVSLVLSIICIRTLRSTPPPEVPFPDQTEQTGEGKELFV
ncbi:MAG TPA: hypothetical protein VGD98_24815 [Ktedonobacteraceae bacterium]